MTAEDQARRRWLEGLDPLDRERLERQPLPGMGTPWEMAPESTQAHALYVRDFRSCVGCGDIGALMFGMGAGEIAAAQLDGIPLLHRHHLTYRKPVRMSYLVMLCEDCHSEWHHLMPASLRQEIARWAVNRSRLIGER
jgi:hypothetical protein